MKVFLFITILPLALGLAEEEVSVETCVEPSIATTNLSISPFPIVFEPENEIRFHSIFNLQSEIPKGSKVKVSLKKDLLVDIPIPCIKVPVLGGIHIGSCEYDLEEIVTKLKDVLCPSYFPQGQECTLPLKPGIYGGTSDGLIATIPKGIPDMLMNLATGTFVSKIELFDDKKKKLICFSTKVELVRS